MILKSSPITDFKIKALIFWRISLDTSLHKYRWEIRSQKMLFNIRILHLNLEAEIWRLMMYVIQLMTFHNSWTSMALKMDQRCYLWPSMKDGSQQKKAGPTLEVCGLISIQALAPRQEWVMPLITASWLNFKTHSCYTFSQIRTRLLSISLIRGLYMSPCPRLL